MNKEQQFYSWLFGEKGARFPYFRAEEMPEIPKVYIPEKYEHLNPQDDIYEMSEEEYINQEKESHIHPI